LAFGTGWLAIAGARKLVAAKREARLNSSGPLTVPHCWEFYDFRRHPYVTASPLSLEVLVSWASLEG
jgi:hypothetical protein